MPLEVNSERVKHYMLRLTANDGALTGAGEVTITVAPAANQAPQVSVSVSVNPQTITLPANSVALSGTVTDDDLPDPPAQVTLAWSQDSGPGAVTFGDAGQANTTATFPAAGTYVLRLTASDGDQSASATVTVTAASQGATQERLLPLGSYPAGVTLGDTKDVIFTVSLVGAPGVVPTRVTLQALDDTGTVVVNHLGSLHDDGLNGDLGAGDFVYSGIFTIAGEHEGKLLYRAKAEISGVGEVVSENYAFVVTPFRVGPQPSDPNRYIEVLDSGLEVVANELLVSFADNASKADIEAAVVSINGEILGYMPGLGIYQIRFGSDGTLNSLTAAIDLLSKNSLVVRIEPNVILYATSFPDDPSVGSQWGIEKIRADEAWPLTINYKRQPTIAILDSGIDDSNPDLTGKIIKGWDFVDADGEPNPEGNNHGTHVAGIAAARGNNGLGIAGVAWDSPIINMRVIDSKGRFALLHGAAAIQAAAGMGARIINCSWGFSENAINNFPPLKTALQTQLDSLKKAVEIAKSQGMLVVAGAGNDGISVPFYPAAFPTVVAIGATDRKDTRWYSKQSTKSSNYGNWITMAAPGDDILSTVLGQNWASASGTSMAAPFVSGAAAVLWSIHPKWTPNQIRDRLVKTAKSLPGQQLGAGRLDLFNAIFDGSFELSNYLVGWLQTRGSSSSIQKGWGSVSPTDGTQFALIQQNSDFAEQHGEVNLILPINVKPETNSLSISFDYNVSLVNVKPRKLTHDCGRACTFYGDFTIGIEGPNVDDDCVVSFATDPLNRPNMFSCDHNSSFAPGKWKKAVVNINTAGDLGLYRLRIRCTGNRQIIDDQLMSAEACVVALDNVVLGGQ